MFNYGLEPELVLPDFTTDEISKKVSEVFGKLGNEGDNNQFDMVDNKSIFKETLVPKLEPKTKYKEDEFVDEEIYDDPLIDRTINSRDIEEENIKEDPTFEVGNSYSTIQNNENEMETGYNFPIQFDLQLANEKFISLMEEVKSKSEKTVVNGKERFHCGLCDEVCAQLPVHVGRNHAELNFKCSQCTVAVGSGYLLRLHEKVHLSQAMPCNICGKEVKDMKNHMLQKHDAVKYGKIKCTECPKVFVKNAEFLRHFNNVHLGLKEPCPICGKEMLPNKINCHVKMVHEKVKNHFCPNCGKGFFDKRDMELHVSRVHLGKKELCMECGKELSAGQLKKHIAKCHSDVDNRVICPECGKKVGSLLEHMNGVHKKLKNFQCPICPLKCYKKNTLNRHMEWHQKGKCTIDGKQQKTRMRIEMKEEIARNLQVDLKDLPSHNPFIHMK